MLDSEGMVRQGGDLEKWPKLGANFDWTTANSAVPHHMKSGELLCAFPLNSF